MSDQDIPNHAEHPIQPSAPPFIPNSVSYNPVMIPCMVLNSNSISICDGNNSNKDMEVVTEDQTEDSSTTGLYRAGVDDDSDEENEQSR